MKLIGNEIKYCEKHIKNGTVDKRKPVKTITSLIKYYHMKMNLSEGEIKQEVMKHLNNVQVEMDEEYIDKLVKTNTSDKVTLNTLDKITITEAEWGVIQEMGRNERERKVLFFFLCSYKIKRGLGYMANNSVRIEYGSLNSDAHVTFTAKQRAESLNYFETHGLIEIGLGINADRITLYYVNDESPIKMEITEFDCLDTYYKYGKKGGKLIICKECGELFIAKQKGRTSTQCTDCYELKSQESKNKYLREKRAK